MTTTNIAIDSTTSSSSSLTRETVDALLQILSPRCKQALETALDSQWELSEACTLEIRSAVPQLTTNQHQHQRQQPPDQQPSSKLAESSSNNPTNAWNEMIHLILNDHVYASIAAVLIFIVVVIVSLIVVRFRDAQRRPTSTKKNKKSK